MERLSNQNVSVGSDIAALLKSPKYRDINTALVLRALQDRIEDYFQWCVRFECPNSDFDENESNYKEYEYRKGYGRALELARELVTVIHLAFSGSNRPIYG
ncbi:MAG: hypothetical protein MN733_00155 [Nitrososphaera sp.]|nr:hypothetical protein [Nitrososphaera sp.]